MPSHDDPEGPGGPMLEAAAALAGYEFRHRAVALERGWRLCGPRAGERLMRLMILDDVAEARRRNDARAVAALELALRHLGRARPDRPGPAGGPRRDDGRLAHALGLDGTRAPWVRERVETHLAAMLRHFGLDLASARERFGPEMDAAEVRCAACAETGRCRRFLAGPSDAGGPSAFCPNAPLFGDLGRRLPPG